jgi:hypothetical protein
MAISFMPRPLYFQEKISIYPLDRKLGDSQNWPGKLLLLPDIELRFLGRPAVAQQLYRLNNSASTTIYTRCACIAEILSKELLACKLRERKYSCYISDPSNWKNSERTLTTVEK